ncbi:Ubiquinone/menaquinone biosynthesis methyltransferase ubiE [Nitrospina gracilis 3/211]|uniref:Demethylmenaquinone methyltransferase n=1 Tax=Nitrospina gracilis (strain 3/211) TaxID=1266370 RepID=M1YM30_NITG3|nr:MULTISPECIES: bifunctional demethylmenaquinone methyltransferase/2-methoxy-6-polyprenyl-1,4-benzoquinol methylase UbiE [Nitrospina]MCF8724386.1 demethylmenaquinone methyltransferase/2-methoxy-6-polyprenyl-1,4-benzoquinol methylase [Nitrospina sp. Nb-3]CCQ91541.1 Ubiquinone/menaquinone biosynthesis methyltransferase ubiE [Nitrospina gracilis 3/211]
MPKLDEEKEAFSLQIQSMFNAIAPRYDFLNRVLSCGVDRFWRKRAVSRLLMKPGGRYLDIACGTGDVALEYFEHPAESPRQVVALDFSEAMLARAGRKFEARNRANALPRVCGAAEALPFPNNSFDGISVAFGVRNFADREQGLREMARVLRPGGRAVILEFSLPRQPVLREPYRVYFERVLPEVGRWVSGHPEAYTYLPQSVGVFPERDEFVFLMHRAGFNKVRFRDMTFGIVTLYVGVRGE